MTPDYIGFFMFASNCRLRRLLLKFVIGVNGLRLKGDSYGAFT